MKYELSESGDVSILRIQEQRLIYENLDRIQEQFISLVESGKRQILIDLCDVEYIDSFAVGFIMDMYRRLTAQEGSLRLSGLRPRVKKILTITRVDNVIDIHPTIEDAIHAFES